jgi:hypothetical protein
MAKGCGKRNNQGEGWRCQNDKRCGGVKLGTSARVGLLVQPGSWCEAKLTSGSGKESGRGASWLAGPAGGLWEVGRLWVTRWKGRRLCRKGDWARREAA